MRAAPLLILLALAACDQVPDDAAAVPPTPLQPPTPKAAAAPADPSDLFFVGRWAARPGLCADGAWVIKADELATAGEVACKFQGREKTAAGYDIPATCWAEGPPQAHRLSFAYAQSAQALTVSGGPFAEMDLVRCPGGAYPPAEPAAPGAPGGLPDDRTPLAEGPIDPAGGQGAGQVLQTYFAHLAERRYRPAWLLWRNDGAASGLDADGFARSFDAYDSLGAQIGAPGRVEGAAGSLQVRVPVQVYGRLKDGAQVQRLGHAVLRRANDTPGATPTERAWRIQALEFAPPPPAA